MHYLKSYWKKCSSDLLAKVDTNNVSKSNRWNNFWIYLMDFQIANFMAIASDIVRRKLYTFIFYRLTDIYPWPQNITLRFSGSSLVQNFNLPHLQFVFGHRCNFPHFIYKKIMLYLYIYPIFSLKFSESLYLCGKC